jgi:hypothetical protein
MTADPTDVVARGIENAATYDFVPSPFGVAFEKERVDNWPEVAAAVVSALRDAGLLVTEPPIEVVVLGAGAPVEPDRPGADGSQQVRLRVEGGPPINVGRYTLRPVSPAGGEEQ